jgi:hypothetical protein
VRTLFFVNAEVRFPHLGPDSLLVVKEPGGSLGAPTLSEAFPESRLVLLVRDPRDVVGSILDSVRPGGFREALESGEDPDELATKRSRIYLRSVQAAARAFDAHVGPKSLVRYEQLRSDALGSMRRLYSDLGLVVDDEDLKRTVERLSWEKIPEDKKGPGKIRRKATPGSWREDLTPKQAGLVEEITAPLLDRFYS